MRVISLVAVAAILVLAGCGAGCASPGQSTYIVIPSATGASGALAAGIYVTFVTPIPLSPSALNSMKKKVTFVETALGPQVCAYSKKIRGVTGKYAYLNGQSVTIKLNGTNPLIGIICSAIQKSGFNPMNIGG